VVEKTEKKGCEGSGKPGTQPKPLSVKREAWPKGNVGNLKENGALRRGGNKKRGGLLPDWTRGREHFWETITQGKKGTKRIVVTEGETVRGITNRGTILFKKAKGEKLPRPKTMTFNVVWGKTRAHTDFGSGGIRKRQWGKILGNLHLYQKGGP